MKNVNIIMITSPDFDIPGVIGGLAALTQHKREFKPTSTEAGLSVMKRLYDMGHTSLFECADFGFIFGSTSRVFLAQITRHRLASYTSGSQQYQDHENFPYVVPASIEAIPEAKQRYDRFMEASNEEYVYFRDLVGKDDARYLIPGAAANHLYAKFNLREIVCALMDQRLCRRNTPESLSNMRTMIRLMCLAGFENCVRFGGCSCVTEGRCNQGRMSCGRPYESWDEMVFEGVEDDH